MTSDLSSFWFQITGPCMNCGIKDSPCWRKGPDSMPVLCNACGTRWARSHRWLGHRDPSMTFISTLVVILTCFGSSCDCLQSNACPGATLTRLSSAHAVVSLHGPIC